MGDSGEACAFRVNLVTVEEASRFAIPGGPPINPMASDVRSLDLICALALFVGARTVVEAGTYRGHTALALGEALSHLGLDSHVWTADTIEQYPEGIATQAIGPLGLQKTVTFFLGDFNDMLNTVPGEIDLAYIDASSVDAPKLRRQHFDIVWPRMKRGGIVIVDDCSGEWDGASEFREQATLYLPQRRGIGIFQKNA